LPTQGADLDATISDLDGRFDSVLASAKNVDKIYIGRLEAITLELLAREKKMAGEGGEPMTAFAGELGTLIGGSIAWGITKDKRKFLKARDDLAKEKQIQVERVVDQERAVDGSSPQVLWQSMEEYLKVRLDPVHSFVHVRFRFRESIQVRRDAAGNLKVLPRIRVVEWGPSAR
jgi:hypothetical protein